jgi:hypothetical protein
MNDHSLPPPPGRGRPFEPRQSGSPTDWPRGTCSRVTLAAATPPDGEAEGLTRKAVRTALAGDLLTLPLCPERVLPRCRANGPWHFVCRGRRATGKRKGPSPRAVCPVMNAVAAALACGEITPGEAATIARVIETFLRAAATSKKAGVHVNLLEFLTAGDDNSDEPAEDFKGEGDEDRDGEP